VRAAGVNPVDAYIHSGTYARKPPLPYTPGQDGAGEIQSVGADVKDFKAGDRVYIAGVGNTVAGAGTYAELAICAPSQLHRLPARASFGQGAALGVDGVDEAGPLVVADHRVAGQQAQRLQGTPEEASLFIWIHVIWLGE